MNRYLDQTLGMDRIAKLRAEAAHDVLVRACTTRNREQARKTTATRDAWIGLLSFLRRAPVLSPSD